MRNVSILSLLAVAALVAAPAFSATEMYDLPDVRTGTGSALSDVIDLADFFGSGATGISVSGGNATVSNGVVSLPAYTSEGVQTVTVNATIDGQAVSREFNVYVSDDMVGGGPMVDDNDRVAGMLGGNIYYNGIVPGNDVSSVEPLDLPDLGGGLTPGAGSAAAVVSIAQVSLNTDDALYRREVENIVSGASPQTNGGLTVTLNADGSYMLETTSSFSGTYLVSLGVMAGNMVDGVSLLAAPATDVDESAMTGTFSPIGSDAQVTNDANSVTVTAAPGQASLVFSMNSLDVSAREAYTMTADVTTDNAGAQVALVAFDGAVGGNVFYSQQWGPNLSASGVQSMALTFTPLQATAVPGLQVLNPSTNTGNATVTISNIELVHAGSVVDYAINVNADVDLPGVDGSFAGNVDGWIPNVLGVADFVAATYNSAENHFAGQGAGSAQLAASAAGVSNIFALNVAVEEGTVLAECYVKRLGAAPAAGASTFALVFTGTGNYDMGAFPDGASVPTDWTLVQVSGTMSVAGSGVLAAQSSAGLDVAVDDIAVRTVDDNDAWFDGMLLQ